MDTTTVDSSGTNTTPEQNPKHDSPAGSTDKYSDARKAKKKKRRAEHRAIIKRSHANG